MKTGAGIKYSFELSARELTHILHALDLAAANRKGFKARQFQDIHGELTKQMNESLEAYIQHFMATLEMSVVCAEEDV